MGFRTREQAQSIAQILAEYFPAYEFSVNLQPMQFEFVIFYNPKGTSQDLFTFVTTDCFFNMDEVIFAIRTGWLQPVTRPMDEETIEALVNLLRFMTAIPS